MTGAAPGTQTLFQQPTDTQPLREAFRPTGSRTGLGVVPVAEAMPGVGEYVRFGRDCRLLVFEAYAGQSFGDIRTVAVAGRENDGLHPRFNGEAAAAAGIDEGLKTGPTALPFDRIRRVLAAGIVFIAV